MIVKQTVNRPLFCDFSKFEKSFKIYNEMEKEEQFLVKAESLIKFAEEYCGKKESRDSYILSTEIDPFSNDRDILILSDIVLLREPQEFVFEVEKPTMDGGAKYIYRKTYVVEPFDDVHHKLVFKSRSLELIK